MLNESNILVYDIGSTYTKASAFLLYDGKLKFITNGSSYTTLYDINVGVSEAKKNIENKGIKFSYDLKVFSSCSAAGGLKLVALGFMPRVTVKAAKEVAMNAGARVMQVISADEPLEFREEVLMEINPDIILLSGGTNDGDEDNPIENANLIAKIKPKATVIVACNIHAQSKVSDILEKANVRYVRVANILPTIHELKVKQAREVIHKEFINQITRAKGLVEFRNSLYDKTVVPTPGAVLLATELLANGYYEEKGIGSTILIDMGGATTDVHSIIPEYEKLSIEERGLVISQEKQLTYRTVEGNLGLRVSATGIVETIGPRAILSKMKNTFNLLEDDITKFSLKLEKNTKYIPETEIEKEIEKAMAASAIEISLKRHAGYITQTDDKVMGIAAGTPIGRDLRPVNKVVCVGGYFVHNDIDDSKSIVKSCFDNRGFSLLPEEIPNVFIDKDYILYALGVLGNYYPREVLNLLKEYIKF